MSFPKPAISFLSAQMRELTYIVYNRHPEKNEGVADSRMNESSSSMEMTPRRVPTGSCYARSRSPTRNCL